MIAPEEYIGMTKQEVLAVLMERTGRTSTGEIHVHVCRDDGTIIAHPYFKTLELAVQDGILLKSDCWEVDPIAKFSFTVFRREEWLRLIFEDARVKYVTPIIWDFE